jgi:arginyl-tRNA synthetase
MIFESEAEKVGKGLVYRNIPEVFQEVENEDGTKSVIFEGKNYTNVFINFAGFGTYLTKDIGLLKIKKEKYPEVKKSLVITDVEQKQHFEMVKEAGEMIDEISDFTQKSEYLQHGRLKFAGNIKISSRYGNVPLVTEIIEKVKNNVLEKMAERNFSNDEKNEISEKLALATLKYSILKVTSGKNITFDLEKDTNPQGNTGIFLMYSLVRAKSIFKKSNE